MTITECVDVPVHKIMKEIVLKIVLAIHKMPKLRETNSQGE